MSLKVVSIEEDGVVSLDCADDMNALAMCEEFTELKDLVGDGWSGRKIALGFAEASYIDSAAIGWLLSLQKTMSEAGGRLVLHSMSPSVKRVITMMRLENVLTMADDLDHALSALKEGA
ncbi:MAG: STAS domain-containing protein [Planctomycetota bacterium]